ncbi:MAG: hypothetical protein ACE5IY_16285 [bacterium]
MRTQVVIRCLAAMALLAGCSASKQAYKKAQEFEQAGLYVEAAEQDLKALRKDPDFKDAKSHLREIAPKAYDELITRAIALERTENWEQTVTEYKKLVSLLSRFHRHGVVFETMNIRERLRKAEHKAAEYHYAHAEQFFANQSWHQAATAYMKAHSYVDNFNRSLDKAIQSYVNAGDQSLRNKRYPEAQAAFHDALIAVPNHPVAKKKLAQSYFLYGRQLFDEGQFREALEQFEQAETFDPESKEIAEWTDRAYNEAVQYVAIFPFVNHTRIQVDGYRLARDLLTLIETRELKFADFLPHPETVSLLSKSALNRFGHIRESELRRIAAEEGLDSFVWGSVLDIEVHDSAESMKEHSHDRVVTVQDSTGKDVEATETIYYREYSRPRRVSVRAEHVIIETETGAVLDRERFTEEITDVARWVAYPGSIYDLPKKKRPLLDAPRSPRPVPILVDEMLGAVVEKISREVVEFYR